MFKRKNRVPGLIKFNDLSKDRVQKFKKFPHYLYNTDVYIIEGKFKGYENETENFDFHDLLIKKIPFLDNIFNNVYGVYICGSVLPLSFVSDSNDNLKDIDIAIENAHLYISIREIRSNIKRILRSNSKFIVINNSKFSLTFTYMNKKYKLDLFGFDGRIENLVRIFHLPCVRGYYSTFYKNLYCFASFIRAIYTGINYNTKNRNFFGTVDKMDIYKKYHNYGFGSVFNKKDAEVFLKYVNTNYKIKKIKKYIPHEELINNEYAKKFYSKHIGDITLYEFYVESLI